MTRPKCPVCRTPSIRIVYGEPTWEAHLAAERGEFKIGGCLIEGAPTRWCPKCEEPLPVVEVETDA